MSKIVFTRLQMPTLPDLMGRTPAQGVPIGALTALVQEVRSKLPQILEIAGRRLRRDAAENISIGLDRFEDAVSPGGWAETSRRW